ATPDSFSDGGRYNSVDRAVEQAVKMEAEGADIIDIGGESTRPGHTPLSAAEELERILPVIEAVEKNVSIPISVDTYKAETAKQVLENGADIINDIWGAKFDPKMAEVVAQYDAPIVLMHNRDNMNYTNLIADMTRDLQESINIAGANGIKDEHIILDPGIGFAKTMQDNLFAMKYLDAFKSLCYPFLLGTTHKCFIWTILYEPVADNRDIGTCATTCLVISKGCQIVRVHNVKANVALRKMME